MFSLLVSGQAEQQRSGVFDLGFGRFLEDTDAAIAEVLRSLSQDAVSFLGANPCVLMSEGRADEPAYLVRVRHVEEYGGGIRLTVESVDNVPDLTNDILWRHRAELGIDSFEFGRNHYSVKDRELFRVLAGSAWQLSEEVAESFVGAPVPGASRKQLLQAKKQLESWGHSEIDDFVLEHGIDGVAGREVGGRKARAAALVEFSIRNPGKTTADGRLLSATIAESCAVPNEDPGLAPVTAGGRGRGVKRESRRVFVVHGHDEAVRDAVAAYLTSLGLEPVVLHEQANMGRHLLTKFIEEAELATFAVVLMTADDVGGKLDDEPELKPRARQNVILELGYFLAHLGQARVCALVSEGLESPSDFDGIVYVPMTADGRWRHELERELDAAGLPLGDVGSDDA